jgi:hypothetical protein
MKLIEKNVGTLNNESLVNGEDFFRFFEGKFIKFLIALFSGFVGVSGNFYAVRFLLETIRIDILTIGSSEVLDFYAFGLTALLDLMIVLFHLMRIKPLQLLSTISAITISLYANYNLLAKKSIFELSIGLLLSILPILILTYLMDLTIKQYDREFSECYHKVK